MKKSPVLLLVFSVLMVLMLLPAISGADPGNGNGNANGIGTGNANGIGNGNGNGNGNISAQQVPEPLTLFLLGSGLVGLAVIKKKIGN